MKSLLVGLLLLTSLTVSAQKYSFVTYSTEEGLPQSQVTSLCQDSAGYLWIGTLGGLAKFNGAEFETYSSNDGLINNRIATVNYFENTLWTGHDGGISIIHNNKISSISFKGNDKSRKVSDIVRFGEDIIVATDGGGLFRLKDSLLERIDMPNLESERIRKVYIHSGIMYLATRGGVFRTRDTKNFEFIDALGDHSYSGITGNEEFIVFTSFNFGVTKMRTFDNSYIHIEQEALKHQVFGGYCDQDGVVWLNSEKGIIKLDRSNRISFLNEKNGLPVNVISCFYQDFEGNMWIGSEGKGIFRFPGLLFKYYDQTTGYPSDLFLCGFQKSNGEFWLGTYDKGLIRQDKNGNVKEIDVNNSTIWVALENVDGKDWFGTQSSLVAVDGKGKVTEFGIEDGLPGRKITSLYKLGNNSMYVGGSEGVALYKDGKFKRIGSKEGEFIGTVRDFEVINSDVYCVTNLGVFKKDNDGFVPLEGTEQVVYSLEKDQFNNLWFGTEEGLYRWNQGKIERIKLFQDPSSNYINFLNHNKSRLYVGTNNGLFVLSDLSASQPKVKRYGKGEGVVDLETNLNSGFFDRKGNFWFGTASGLICYHPEGERKNPSIPSLNIKRILLNYQEFDYALYASGLTGSGLPLDLILPNSKNNLMIELDGVSLIYHEGLKYQFYLEGSSDEWSPLTDVATITFTSLPAGSYELKMRAVDLEGRASQEVVLPFTIKEAFYRTWWFYSICIALVALIVISIFRFRLRRINEINAKEKLEFKAKLLALEQKSINASMNRHFIFNALNSIQYFINTQDRLSANKYLTNFAQLIRKNLDSATADNNTITLEEELSRIKLYLSLEAMRFKDRFEYNINVEGVDTESIMIPSMILQPFVENSIIHGILPNEDVKGNITIRVKRADDGLDIIIEDNGIGIDQSMSKKAEIEGDHRSQGMEITSKRIELIKKISDIGISLEGPQEIIGDDGSIKGTRVLLKIPQEYLEF